MSVKKISRYVVSVNNSKSDYIGIGNDFVEVGRVIDILENNILGYIIYNKNNYEVTGYNFCSALEMNENDNKETLIIYVGDEHRNLMYNNMQLFSCFVMHELGHFLNGDLKMAENNAHALKERNKIKDIRTDYILNGKVMPNELAADKFAVEQIGKSRFINAIDYMMKQRKIRKYDPGKELALKEFENRKKAIKKM